jgi:DNA polymerase III alpha subunit
VERLLEEAQKKNITSFVLTDINNTSGWYELLQEARKVNIDVKAGIEFRNGNTKLFIGIAKNADGFAELNRYLSYYLKNKLDIPTEAPTFKNVFIIYPYNEDKTYQLNENEYIGVNKNDLTKLRFPKKRQLKDKMVALQTVTFANKKDFSAHRILRAMDKLSIITKLTDEDLAKQNEQFETYDELIKAYDDHAYLLHNAQKLIDQCSFDFTFHTNKNIQLLPAAPKKTLIYYCNSPTKVLPIATEKLPKKFRIASIKNSIL